MGLVEPVATRNPTWSKEQHRSKISVDSPQRRGTTILAQSGRHRWPLAIGLSVILATSTIALVPLLSSSAIHRNSGIQSSDAPPAAPTGLVVVGVSTTAVYMNWTNPSGSLTDDEVNIYSDSSCLAPLGAIDLGGVASEFEWGGLSAGTTYGFTVQAATSGGFGPDSSCASAATDSGGPAAPIGLTALVVSETAIYLNWTNPFGQLTDNEVNIYSDGACTLPLGAIDLGAVATQFEWGGLSPDTTYGFTVQGGDTNGFSPDSNCASATTYAALPGAVSGLSATPVSDSAIYLNWTNPTGPLTDDEVVIYADGSCATPLGAIDLGEPGTQFEWGDLTSDATYGFTIEAATNEGFGPESSCVSATTDSEPAGAPTGLAALVVSASAIYLNWTNPSGALTDTQVNIFSDSSCSTPLGAIDLGEVTTEFEWGGLSADTTYGFTVQAVTTGGPGPQSACASATTNGNPPGAPIGLGATAESDSAVYLNWTNPSGSLTDDLVDIYSGPSCTTPLGAIDLGGVITEFEWGGLTPDSTYSFTVQAASAGGLGPQSNCAVATTESDPLTPHSMTSADSGQTSQLVLSALKTE